MAGKRSTRPGARPHRLFVAVSIPDSAADAIEATIQPWRRAFPKARWTPRANWHVTVRFLGPTYPRLVPWVREQLGDAAAACAPFETRVRGLGGFPSARRARVLWAGLDDTDGGFTALASSIQHSLRAELEFDERPFKPHVTVARSDPPIHLPADLEQTLVESSPFPVVGFELMRSHVGSAPRYESIEAYRLSMGD